MRPTEGLGTGWLTEVFTPRYAPQRYFYKKKITTEKCGSRVSERLTLEEAAEKFRPATWTQAAWEFQRGRHTTARISFGSIEGRARKSGVADWRTPVTLKAKPLRGLFVHAIDPRKEGIWVLLGVLLLLRSFAIYLSPGLRRALTRRGLFPLTLCPPIKEIGELASALWRTTKK
ncbi:hypothetical protein NDU88_002581 [Pleurodeles waltl]|uniref:Uncharacterized protein n=1 Tax=Pleurodeles waltl TaxID=8319 RepID=A0AAV7KZC8_PLEWA|nr:hypothetical protein NDU88_002581 [Pleurodeles waltl]